MKILVTGGAGFIGSAMIRHLITTTDYKIINCDKLTYAGNLESLAGLEEMAGPDRYFFEPVDICDLAAVRGLFLIHCPDAVMHLAAESHVDRSIEGPAAFIHTNIHGTYTLLAVALDYWRGRDPGRRFRFHHISTDEVFGDLGATDPPFTETTSYNPSSPYAASKASADHLVRAWRRTYGLPALITNCSNNYGPYQFPEKLIPHMILNALHGRPLPVYGDGHQIRDWLFVDDHAQALHQVLVDGRDGEDYNIGGDNEVRNIDVVTLICQLLEDLAPNRKPHQLAHYRDLITFVKDRPGHDRRYAIDTRKIIRDLDWKPKETFTSGLRRTVLWYLENERWWQRVLNGSYRLQRIGL